MPTLVCFGDSLTAGEKGENGERRLTSRIREKMSPWIVINAGIPNGTSRDGLQRFQEDVLIHDPDIVTIFFGTDDANRRQLVTVAEFKTNLLYMIQKLQPQQTILISPPPLAQRGKWKYSNDHIETLAMETRRLATETGCPFIDFWELAQTTAAIQANGETLSDQGYEILANEIMKQMRAFMKRKKLRSS